MPDDPTPRHDAQHGADPEGSEQGIVSVGSGEARLLGQAGGIPVDKPAAGETLKIATRPGQAYSLTFDLADVRILTKDGDIIYVFADGSRVVLEGAAALAEAGEGPNIVAADSAVGPLLIGEDTLGEVQIEAPGPEETVEIVLVAGTRYFFTFDPTEARVLVVNGALVLLFSNGGKIVFPNASDLAGAEIQPAFVIAGLDFPVGLLADLALAEYGGSETPFSTVIETAAPEVLLGSGGNVFAIPGGRPIDLLVGGDVVPPRALEFSLIEPQSGFIEGREEQALINTTPLADEVLTTADFEPVPQELIEILESFSSLPPFAPEGLPATLLPEIVFFKQLTVDGVIGDDDTVTASFGGFDAETPLELLVFTITSLPQYGTIYIVDGDTGDVSIAVVGSTFGAGDTVWYAATLDQVNEFLLDSGLSTPPDVSFTYQVSDFDLNSADATVTIGLPQADVSFGITVISEDSGNDSPSQLAVISEDVPGDNAATFTITLGGDLLTTGNRASVTVGVGGTASDGVDYTAAIFDAIKGVADATAGVSFDSTTGVLTFDSTAPTSLSFTVTAVDDSLVEPVEDVIVTLSDPTILFGSAVLTSGQTSAEVEIISEDQPPTANPDEDMVLEGGFRDTEESFNGGNFTTGNVITGEDTDAPPSDGMLQADEEGSSGPLTVVAADQDGTPITIGVPFLTALGGTLTLNADGSYTYFPPPGGVDHSQGPVQEVFNYTIENGDGLTDSTTLTIQIKDTAPTANPDEDMVEEGGTFDGELFIPNVTTGNVITGIDPDLDPVNQGVLQADDPSEDFPLTVIAADQGGNPITIGVPFATALGGTLLLKSDGSYEYTPPLEVDNSEGNLVEVFNYTISDGDGSTSSTTLTIEIKDANAPIGGQAADMVREAALDGNPPFAAGTDPSSTEEAVSGLLGYDFGGDGPAAVDPFVWSTTVVAADGDLDGGPFTGLTSGGDAIIWTVSLDGLTLTGTVDPAGTGPYAGEVIATVVVTDVNSGAYTFTLFGAIDSPDAASTEARSRRMTRWISPSPTALRTWMAALPRAASSSR